MDKKWVKYENGIVKYPPKNDIKRGLFNVDKNEKWLTTRGYKLMTQEEIDELLPKPIELPKKYSTLKIIRALTSEWNTYKTKMEEAGVLDQFFAANYLEEDDPVFQAFLETVPEELKMRLDECIWEE